LLGQGKKKSSQIIELDQKKIRTDVLRRTSRKRPKERKRRVLAQGKEERVDIPHRRYLARHEEKKGAIARKKVTHGGKESS